MEPEVIVGAGLAGLLAAHTWPRATIVEAAPGPRATHRALLRFRSPAVSLHTGIDFRQVTVRKGIWFGGTFHEPSIFLANSYSDKILGTLEGDRSIWSLDAVQRWIAPETFYEQMLETFAGRIAWNNSYSFQNSRPIVSTAPLPSTMRAVGWAVAEEYFRRSPIRVERYRVDACNVHQTVYYPSHSVNAYRASITGDLLIVESVGDKGEGITAVLPAFCIGASRIELIDAGHQQFGKIVTLPELERRGLLYRLTDEHKIFSLGRFATWRNVLLDDVVNDLAVIRRLLRAEQYQRSIFAATPSSQT